MIPRKKKECLQCQKEKFIFSHGRCKECANLVAQSLKKTKKVEKKETVSELKSRLDEIFSLYIRFKNAKDGVAQCYTCKKYAEIKKLQCGHYISRKHLSLRWEEKNCFVQCYECNVAKSGNYRIFLDNLIEDFGIEYVNNLEQTKNNSLKMTSFEYNLLITNYKEKVNQLKEESEMKENTLNIYKG